MTDKIKPILHGEVMVTKTDSLPANAKPLTVEGPYLIVGESEAVGNHHVVDNVEGCEFFEVDGVRYMKNSKPTSVRCLHESRHDKLPIPPGIHKFGPQLEYDYFTESLRAVQD